MVPRTAHPRSGSAAWAVLAIVVLGALAVRVWHRGAEAAGFGWIEPARLSLIPPPVQLAEHLDPRAPWVDPRWSAEAAHRLARFERIRTDDEAGQEALARELAALSFVESVAVPEVVWPDGLRIPIRLRQPVACLAVGDAFQAVAADGTLLSGRWDAPPAWGEGWLPTLRLGTGDAGVLDGRLDEALGVARSMQTQVSGADHVRLGRVVLDASKSLDADPLGRRVDLLLEDGRVAVFGRAPRDDRPGELPAEHKWRSLGRALDLAESGGTGSTWTLVDLRWDRPELRLEQEHEGSESDLGGE